ncbi:MAG: M23 family metallopeptidase [Gemmatimonadetes bacterium]|nr:M23 family metallopeptidase [Gemmatimonadota bacterium]
MRATIAFAAAALVVSASCSNSGAGKGPQEYVTADTLRDEETLDILLRRGGLDGPTVREVLAATPMIDPRRVRPELAVEFVRADSAAPTREVRFKLAIDRLVSVSRVLPAPAANGAGNAAAPAATADSAAGGRWTAVVRELPWTYDTIVVRGAVGTNLYDATGDSARSLFPGASHEALVLEIADVYKYRVDMTRELQPGDSVQAVVERARGPENTTRVRRVLASRLQVNKKPIQAYHYQVPGIRNVYFDAAGKSLATAFLHAPIEFARVTSAFGMRYHPILGVRRPHRGLDYGARSGTPIMSIGDGTVTRVGSEPGGFGNIIEVRHPNGYVSRYAHLSRFARGMARGVRVQQEDIIGYVGATGLATAPHLHFEILVGGRQTSPSLALRNVDGTPMPNSAKSGFETARHTLSGLLSRGAGVITATSAQ